MENTGIFCCKIAAPVVNLHHVICTCHTDAFQQKQAVPKTDMERKHYE